MKVHIWAGISMRGPTKVCIFDGIMDAELYIEILQKTLLLFIAETYPEGHRFMQDMLKVEHLYTYNICFVVVCLCKKPFNLDL